MTVRKTDNLLRGDRTPAYVGRETGAAELQISPDTWDQWVKEGRLPKPCDAFPIGTPRWRWADVDRRLSGGTEVADTDEASAFLRGAHFIAQGGTDAAMRGALNFGTVRKKRGRPRVITVPKA